MLDQDSQKNEGRLVVRERLDADLSACADALMRVHASDSYPVEGVAHPLGWLQPPGLICSWVAEISESIVGHVSVSEPAGEDAVTFWREQSGATADQVGVLARLFVVSEARGHGAGEQLTQAATAYAYQHGRRLVLDVMSKDRAAIRLYKRLGWVHIGDTRHTFGDRQSVPAHCFVSPGGGDGRAEPAQPAEPS